MTALILLSKFKETEIEIWRPIEGFRGYEVSNLGRIRSYWRKSGCGKTGGLFASGKRRGSWTYVLGDQPIIRILGEDKDGYKFIIFSVNGKIFARRVHRLVAAAFIDNERPKTAIKVNHKTNVKYDNRVPNLEWCTQRENEDHARRIGVWPVGERNGNSKVSEDDVREIRRRVKAGETKVALAREFGMTATGISLIARRKNYRHVS